MFPSTDEQTEAEGVDKGVYKLLSPYMIVVIVNEPRVTASTFPQGREAGIPTLLKVTSVAGAHPVDGNTG